MDRTPGLACLALIAGLWPGAPSWARGEGHGSANAAPPAFEVCRRTIRISGSARPGLGGPLKLKIYLSDIMPRGPINDETIRLAFEDYVNQKYGLEYGGVDCSYAYTLEEAQKIQGSFRQEAQGQTLIETGWKYAPPAKPAPPPPAHSAVCWAHTNGKFKYYSSVFDGSRDDARAWGPAFEMFLKEKYGFNGPAQCIADRTEADAQQYLKTLIDQDSALKTYDGKTPQIVETGWKY